MSVSAAFDSAAARYDQEFTESVTGRAQRALVRGQLARVLRRPSEVFELNCGTGADALWLAGQGHRVLATDISPGMVARVEARATGASGVRAQVLAVEDIAGLEGQFDLIFSNFGGLNCVAPDHLPALARELARLTRPGGHAVLVIMPRLCLWESLYGALRRDRHLASRRWAGGPVQAHLGGGAGFPVWYFAPRAFARAFAPGFRHVATRPVGFAVPPSAMERFAGRAPGAVRLAQTFDHWAPGALAGAADHACLILERAP